MNEMKNNLQFYFCLNLTDLVVKFAVDSLVPGIQKLKCVAAITIHVSKAIGSATIRKQNGHLMSGLWPKRQKVPEHVRIFQVRYRVALLGVYEAWKLEHKRSAPQRCI